MGAIFGILGRVIGWAGATFAGQWALKGLLGVGVGFVMHKWATPALMAYVQSKAAGMSSFVFQAFGAIGGDVAFSMIISATVAAVSGNAVLKAIQK